MEAEREDGRVRTERSRESDSTSEPARDQPAELWRREDIPAGADTHTRLGESQGQNEPSTRELKDGWWAIVGPAGDEGRGKLQPNIVNMRKKQTHNISRQPTLTTYWISRAATQVEKILHTEEYVRARDQRATFTDSAHTMARTRVPVQQQQVNWGERRAEYGERRMNVPAWET
ncbi:uncharacterized protein B0H18DRAFT_1131894 [Fomitopsis serialis]|uniref:uncharacterized protein n=1 Tax=Fomitopsis serialis TaxID=139415 RepID=UPI002007435E|nr:uncharacterized protein B0H18DRAFT_1131894 [Neoantrodia serialis]KAH9906576.1 hypothetical protein B0H18DRAFT_1131894 [Neoantrodia serialis]